MLHNRQWLLKSRPQGALTLDNFEFRERDKGGMLIVQSGEPDEG